MTAYDLCSSVAQQVETVYSGLGYGPQLLTNTGNL